MNKQLFTPTIHTRRNGSFGRSGARDSMRAKQAASEQAGDTSGYLARKNGANDLRTQYKRTNNVDNELTTEKQKEARSTQTFIERLKKSLWGRHPDRKISLNEARNSMSVNEQVITWAIQGLKSLWYLQRWTSNMYWSTEKDAFADFQRDFMHIFPKISDKALMTDGSYELYTWDDGRKYHAMAAYGILGNNGANTIALVNKAVQRNKTYLWDIGTHSTFLASLNNNTWSSLNGSSKATDVVKAICIWQKNNVQMVDGYVNPNVPWTHYFQIIEDVVKDVTPLEEKVAPSVPSPSSHQKDDSVVPEEYIDPAKITEPSTPKPKKIEVTEDSPEEVTKQKDSLEKTERIAWEIVKYIEETFLEWLKKATYSGLFTVINSWADSINITHDTFKLSYKRTDTELNITSFDSETWKITVKDNNGSEIIYTILDDLLSFKNIYFESAK